MTVFNYVATPRKANSKGSTGIGGALTVIPLIATQEVAAAASASTVSFGKIPSNARILGASKVYTDDLATSGSPTLDLGLYAVNGNITSDDDCLNDGLNVSSAAASNNVIKDVANFGKQAWEFVNGQTVDPGGELEVKGVIRDAATNATGTVTMELLYAQD